MVHVFSDEELAMIDTGTIAENVFFPDTSIPVPTDPVIVYQTETEPEPKILDKPQKPKPDVSEDIEKQEQATAEQSDKSSYTFYIVAVVAVILLVLIFKK